MANRIANDVVDEIDVGSALTGGDVTEDLDGESLGRSIGETVGETLGRVVGRGVVRWTLSKLTFWDDEDPSLAGKIGRSLVVALGRTLQKPEFKQPLGDAFRGLVDQLEERQQAAKDAAADAGEETKETAGDAAEQAKETASDAAEQAEDSAESAEDAAGDAADAVAEEAESAAERLAAGDMDELRKETYRELLEMMEYSKIQSIAKQSGVKANQQRDEMIDAIVDNFDADEDAEDSESEGEDNSDDAEEASEDESESDESDDDESS